MTTKLPQNQWAKAARGSWLLSLASILESFLFYLLVLFIPSQFGKHFWPSFSFVLGQRIDYLSPTLYVTDVLLFLLFLVTLPQRKMRISPLFSLFVLFVSITIFFSASPLVGWYFLIKFLEMSFLTWLMVSKSRNTVLLGLFFSAGILVESFIAQGQVIMQRSLGGVFYFFGERSFTASTPGIANASLGGQLFLRPYGTFSHPNMLAGFLVVSCFLVLYFLNQKKKKAVQAVLYSSILIGAVGIVLSLSRAALFAWGVSGVILIGAWFKKTTTAIALTLMALGTSTLLVSFLFPEVILRFLPISFGQSVSERTLLAVSALSMLKSNFLFGVGFGNFLPSLPSFSGKDIILQPVHNIYLLTASELGFFGIFFFLWFLWEIGRRLFQKIYKKDREALPLFLAFMVLLATGLLDHYWLTLQQGELLFALVVGLVLKEIKTPRGTMEE